ncbi:hypothetical protein FWH58_02215 [Candidatus Saccharibacteria bacterium]|nr:hypothetical protein [Candidatus Saccharibacteria bacterium]
MDSFAMTVIYETSWRQEWQWSAGVIVGAVCSGLIMYVLNAFLLGRLFRKAGVPAWKAWVPVLNIWKLFQIGGRAGVWALLPLVIVLSVGALGFVIPGYSDTRDWQANDTMILISLMSVVIISAVAFLAQYISAMWSITKKLDKSLVYMLLLLVNLGPSLWLWIMALDKSKWNDKLGSKSLAPETKKKK